MIEFAEEQHIKILFTSLTEIPHFLSAKADVKKFTIADLSLNADVKALERLSISELILLLNYLNVTNLLQLITQSNIQQLLQNAKQNQNKIFITKLKEEIEALLQEKVNYENILQLGLLLGKLQFAIYKSGNVEEQKELVSFQQRIDKYSFNYILSGNLKNIFYEQLSSVKSVDRIIPYFKTKSQTKLALICFDCMGIAEWELLKNYLQPLETTFYEKTSFALIPTITGISRNSIYFGNHTVAFQLKAINEGKELQQRFPGNTCKLFREKDSITADTLLGINVVSIIYNFFDDISHSIQFPSGFENKSIYFDAVKNYLINSNVLQQMMFFHKK